MNKWPRPCGGCVETWPGIVFAHDLAHLVAAAINFSVIVDDRRVVDVGHDQLAHQVTHCPHFRIITKVPYNRNRRNAGNQLAEERLVGAPQQGYYLLGP
jgi:hypothetical protein